ncbi:MAG: hypothetical protein KDC98_20375, partial [Planctomycetes bacterium]|nr:hypothetical protein [Planctomycetota bacterium]
PILGSPTFRVTLDEADTTTAAMLFVGFSAFNHLGMPLPMDLGPFGLQHCQLLVAPTVVTGLTPVVNGQAVRPLPLPANPSIAGLRLFFQWLCMDPEALDSAGLTTSLPAASILWP